MARTKEHTHDIAITPARVGRTLFGVAVFFALVNLVILYLEQTWGLTSFPTRVLAYYFDVSLEHNVPALFSTLLLFAASILLFCIRYGLSPDRKKEKRQWLVLALIFVFLMLDEATRIHEQFNRLRETFGSSSGYLYYAWVIPYSNLALCSGIYLLGLVKTLPAKTGRLFIVSGGIFVFSAIFFEILEGRITVLFGAGHMYNKLLCIVEELGEMSGIVLFIYALLNHLFSTHPCIVIKPGRCISYDKKRASKIVS